MRIPDFGRWVRTISALHPIQIFARATRPAVTRLGKHVPIGFGPRAREPLSPVPGALVSLTEAEQRRMRSRLPRIAFDRQLAAYETRYGLDRDLFVPAERTFANDAGLAPFVAAIRARALSVAIRRGAGGLEGELTRACRAVAVQLELHLLANHLLENGFALCCAGSVTAGVEAEAWWVLGSAILGWQLDEQFLADGGHFERSASYHVALTAALLETIELARAGGRDVPGRWLACADRAVGFISEIEAPDGTYPLFNDAALDAAPPVDTVLDLARTLGITTRAATTKIRNLEATGWVIARNARAMLVVDVAEDGASYCPGHAHADALTIELWVDGRRVIVDYGVGAYGEGPERTRTRSTRVHNTVQLDGVDAAEVWSAFRVGRRSRSELVSCAEDGDAAVIAVENRGYTHLRGAPVHRRTLRLTAWALEVEDRVSSWAGPWVSRLRVDAETNPSLSARGPVTVSRDRWYPEHGHARDAVVYEQTPRGSCHFTVPFP